MKLPLTLLFFVLCFQAITRPLTDTLVTTTTFPDPEFRKYIFKTGDRNGDARLDSSEVAAIHLLKLDGLQIHSLEGIQLLLNLDTLLYSDSHAEVLDLRKNDKMVYLLCLRGTLSSVTVSKKAPYNYIFLNDNALSNFDASGLGSLKTLGLAAQNITYLNIRGTKLQYLTAFENPKMDICTDSIAQWEAIPSNTLRQCALSNPNASYCSYTLKCAEITEVLTPEGVIIEKKFRDFDVMGKEVTGAFSGGIVFRVYEDGTREKRWMGQP